VGVAARQARRTARYDERSDHGGVVLEADGQMPQVVAQVGGQLQRRSGPAHHHDGNGAGRAGCGLVETLVEQRLAQSLLPPAVGQVHAVDPERRTVVRVIDEHGLQGAEQITGLVPRRSHTMRDDVERRAADARAQPAQEWLDPRAVDLDADDALEAELHGALIPPEQGVARVETRQRRGGDRAHVPIVAAVRPAQGAGERSVDGSAGLACCGG